ncbi:streptomycin 6-kinase [Pedococcus dokdonensis]|uniref:Streptomycin 6-kinase n=1 Tax=Pedococcus dokdonensis TaxID=443156 RepID=A0A1H0TNW1_9MICO|nr:aminoglycoside phosphotransferase family protein [Pedococcus dokdonensis]SDP55623.1 streptomycin 6-kinase [Pedococcus dokdonensis]
MAGRDPLDEQVARVVDTARAAVGDHPALAPVLDGLADLLADLVERWSLTLGEVYSEGLGVPVVAVLAEGAPAVLKIERPGPAFAAQVATLEAAHGRGYAAVLASDPGRGAVLLERLGSSLASSGLAPAAQVDHLTAALRLAWELPVALAPEVARGDDKAAQLAEIVRRFRQGDDDDRWGAALDRAHELARHLSASRDPGRDVLCHGDPHPGNALQAKGIPRYKLVDPDGFRCEPEYDVGVTVRDFSRAVLACRDHATAVARHDALCVRAADATGTDVDRVRQWAFVERVTTGLYLRWFHDEETAETFLDSATVLVPDSL